MLIFCCFRALAYTTLDRLCAVFLYNLGQRSLEVIQTGATRKLSYLPSIVTTAISLTVYEILRVKLQRDLENWVKGCSRSLKLAPFDRPYTSSYWSAIINNPLIINKHFNFCCFRAMAYTTLDRLCAVFLYNLVLYNFVPLLSYLTLTLKSGSLKISQTGVIRKLGCSFLFTFHSNCGSTLHHFREQDWSKIRIFS